MELLHPAIWRQGRVLRDLRMTQQETIGGDEWLLSAWKVTGAGGSYLSSTASSCGNCDVNTACHRESWPT